MGGFLPFFMDFDSLCTGRIEWTEGAPNHHFALIKLNTFFRKKVFFKDISNISTQKSCFNFIVNHQNIREVYVSNRGGCGDDGLIHPRVKNDLIL